MPMTTAIVVTGIALAFVLFGSVLAWGDRQTRKLPIVNPEANPPAKDDGTHQDWPKAA